MWLLVTFVFVARSLGHPLLVFCILFPYLLDPGLTFLWTLLLVSLHLTVTYSPLLTGSLKWFTFFLCPSYLPVERLLSPCLIM